MAVPVLHQKSFGNLKYMPEFSNQINTKRSVILLIVL